MSWCIQSLKTKIFVLLSSHLKLISPRFDSKSPFFNLRLRRFIVLFSISFPLHVNYSIAFVSRWLRQRHSALQLLHPQRFDCLRPSERMYISQWAWILDEESCESFWLFNVRYIKEPLFQPESQLCGSILNWDRGAESGFTYERMGISQGQKNSQGHGVICNY